MQAALNNFKKYFSTDKTSTEILFNFCIHKALDLLYIDNYDEEEEAATTQDLQEGYTTEVRMVLMTEYRSSYINIKNAIAFTAMCIKEYYDISHTSKYFKISDRVNLQLHCRYTIPGIQNRKIQQQFVSLFKVTERIDQLTYRLDLPLHWQVHDVISIAHLKQVTTVDLYNCSHSDHPPAVAVEEDLNHYEIDRLLQKRVRKSGHRGHRITIKYLIRWKGYSSEHDV